MNSHLNNSRTAKALFTITTSIILLFIINQAQGKSLKKGEIYSSLTGKQVIEVISENELEIHVNGDIILLANYNFKDGKLRIVYTVFGTKKVEYYEIIEEGLWDRKGKILYSKAAKLKAEEDGAMARAAKLKAEYDDKNTGLGWFGGYDIDTGLEWFAGPDIDTSWYEAKSWVENFNIDAGGGWRMPTRAELKSLFKKEAGSLNMTLQLVTDGWWVWSGEIKGSSSAWYFCFDAGNEQWNLRDRSYLVRGCAVRSQKDRLYLDTQSDEAKIAKQKLKDIKEYFEFKDLTGNLKINTSDIKSKFVENSKTGKLFVITGRAENEYLEARGLIKITGKLFTKGKKLSQTKTVFCGNVMSDLDLATLDLDAINKRLGNRFGDNRSNVKVKPGKTIPFMIVFSKLPSNLDEFTIKVAGSSPDKRF